jgi:hypothetical protein
MEAQSAGNDARAVAEYCDLHRTYMGAVKRGDRNMPIPWRGECTEVASVSNGSPQIETQKRQKTLAASLKCILLVRNEWDVLEVDSSIS